MGNVGANDALGSGHKGVEAKGSGVAECVKDVLSSAVFPNFFAVKFLVKEVAGLLPLGQVHLNADGIFNDCYYRRIRAFGGLYPAAFWLQAFLKAHVGVAPLVNGEGLANFFERGNYFLPKNFARKREELDKQVNLASFRDIALANEARQKVRLAKDKPKGVAAFKVNFTQVERVVDFLKNEGALIRVDFLRLLRAQNSDGDF